MGRLRRLAGQARDRFLEDVRRDPSVLLFMGVALVLGGAYVWHGVPNFATWDGRDRMLDPLIVFGRMLDEPGLVTLHESVVWGRQPFGATHYLYGLAVLPVVIAAALRGELGALTSLGYPNEAFGFYQVWQTTPEWVWTWSIVLSRSVSVLFAAASVYMTYRIGTYLRDRTTGRIAAALLSVSWGMATLTHEIGEDVPALFTLLVTLYLLAQYVDTGAKRPFFIACAIGGFSIAIKLSSGLIVPTIGLVYFLRSYKEHEQWQPFKPADRPFLMKGAAIGAIAVLIGFPTLLVGGVLEFGKRIVGNPARRVVVVNGPDTGIWWWFLRGYFQSFSLPVFVAAVGGVGAAVVRFRKRWPDIDGSSVLLAYLAVHLAVLSTWHSFRPHHLIPTVPVILVFLAMGLARLRERRPAVGTAVVAFLLVTSGAYAAVGVAGYGSMPRDEAVGWMDDNVDRDATMEFYVRGIDEAAVPHWLNAQYPYVGNTNQTLEPCPDYVQLTHRDLLHMRDIPDDQRSMYTRTYSEVHGAYVRGLLNGSYDYEIVAEFGDRPPNYVPDRPQAGSLVDILELGIYPQSDQYGDEQELQANQFVVILEHTGGCEQPLPRPENVTVRDAGQP